MFNRANIIIAVLIMFKPKSLIEGVMHPTNSIQKPMTCDEFSQSARFNPYAAIGDLWMAFYYWAPHSRHLEYTFSYPNPRERTYLKEMLVDNYVTIPVNWTARYVVMIEQSRQEATLLVEKGERGQFWLYPFTRELKKGSKLAPIDVRFKQTGDNKYIGMMNCETETVYVMSRKTEIPPKAKIQDAAACIGYRGRGGKSYLYQGHEWMPITEADEDEYWNREAHTERFMEELKMADEIVKMEQRRKKRTALTGGENYNLNVDKKVLV